MTPADSDAHSHAHSDAPPLRKRGRPPSGGREAIVAATVDLLRERGASRLTTREVAQRAGVSEGSVFYHFGDRSGLLTAVINDGLRAFANVHSAGAGDVEMTLDRFTAALEEFLDIAFVAMVAAQSDAELRTGMADHFVAHDLGPHRGVEALGGFMRRAQAAGLVRRDVDADALAMLVIGTCFLRVSMVQMIGPDYAAKFPERAELVHTVATLLQPLDS
ncbi:MAG: regulatory protein TetR [Frankiales bacterium]|nr:regulatory protein TetR [Frankiales bacterium]